MGNGRRLVTVVVTLAVPDSADPDDAAALVAEATTTSAALDIRHIAAVEGHLPLPGQLTVRITGHDPWRTESVHHGSAVLTDLTGHQIRLPLTDLAPDPLHDRPT